MAHDSQVKAEPNDSSENPASASKGRRRNSSQASSEVMELQRRLEGQRQCSEVIGKWTSRYFAMYREEPSDAVTEGFYAMLRECSDPVALNKAFQAAAEHAGDENSGRFFRPNAAEVKVAYMKEMENMPNRKSSHEHCEICRGTGWQVLPRPDGQGNYARRCLGGAV